MHKEGVYRAFLDIATAPKYCKNRRLFFVDLSKISLQEIL